MLRFKFHIHHTINEEFNIWEAKGGGVIDYKNSEKPHTER